MTRIDTAATSVDDVAGLLEQKSVSAIARTTELRDGGGSHHAQQRLADMREGADKLAGQSGPDSVQVDLSGAGKAMAAGRSRTDRNADIDESDLPDQIKDLLKRIRQIRAELSRKQAELRVAMADKQMRPDQRKMKVSMLQGEIAVLSGALVLASKALGKLVTELKLTPDQAAVAGSLMMA